MFAFSGASFAQIKLRNALDYDGDGRADFGVFRNSASASYALRSGGNSFSRTNFGVSDTDTLAPGDYDGDGKADIAVLRETSGTFYVLKSSDNSVYGMQRGLSADVPIAALDSH